MKNINFVQYALHQDMNPIIETNRLILHEFRVSDAKDFFRLNSDPDVLQHTGDSPFGSVSEASLFLKNYNDYKKNGFGRWAVTCKESNKYLGWCGLKLNEENFVDLGFRFFKNEWGKGYATESAKASLAYGFNQLNINEIIGRASSDNKASVKVLEKLQMKFWKHDNCKGIRNLRYYKLTKKGFNDLNPIETNETKN